MPVDQEQIAHDQLFKDLLRAFFREFMELFFADVAARLDFQRVVPRDQELFTDVPVGEVRETDLVTQVHTRDGEPEVVLIHVEVETRQRQGMGERMFEYYMLLRLRFKLPVFAVVIYVTRGRGALGTAIYHERLFGRRAATLEYWRIALPNLPAEEYLATDNPLAYGLAALMKPDPLRPAEVKLECLLKIARALIDEARKVLLLNCVETYLRLDPVEQQAFEQIAQQPGYEGVSEMRTVYEQRGIVLGKQDDALRLLRRKFGELPEAVERHVRALDTEAELNRVLDAILDASALEDVGLTSEGNDRD